MKKPDQIQTKKLNWITPQKPQILRELNAEGIKGKMNYDPTEMGMGMGRGPS